jgi:hypothetical protein
MGSRVRRRGREGRTDGPPRIVFFVDDENQDQIQQFDQMIRVLTQRHQSNEQESRGVNQRPKRNEDELT